ncbi:hypothetical protein [Alteribacillus bidgolensis]|uniref:hypothetical protein n=1 Tax=Alteribacillus bidgolensis TaxID=930129 RepID=UPI000B80FD1B|nr:hypothetical protein [Alteribacillus bidgolensis]
MNTLSLMTQSYQYLYAIETSLRKTIAAELLAAYGTAWEHRTQEKHAFATCYYHELIPYFAKYPPLQKFFTEMERKQLYQLTPIRNKICHMKNLKEKEFKQLKNCYQLVESRLTTLKFIQ